MPACRAGDQRGCDDRIAVVVVTHDRRDELLRTLRCLDMDSGAAEIVVVDNASSDGTAATVQREHPHVRVLSLPRNLGAVARNHGVRAVSRPYVAFADDDSWWSPGSLARAADLLDMHPDVAVIGARVLVGDEEELDPTCRLMAAGRLGTISGLPGPTILGFLACGSVVRRDAFLEVGGFCERMGTGGEEELLALDLVDRGRRLVYVHEVVAHHHPSAVRDPDARMQQMARNAIFVAWLRLPVATAIRSSVQIWRRVGWRAGLHLAVECAAAIGWLVHGRRPLGAEALRARQILDGRITPGTDDVHAHEGLT